MLHHFCVNFRSSKKLTMGPPTSTVFQLCSGNLHYFDKIFLLANKAPSYYLKRVGKIHQQSVKFQHSGEIKNLNNNIVGPLQCLEEKIANGEIMLDDYQKKITESLQRVYVDIQGYTPPIKGLFSRFFKKEENIPKGLYIHGAVGGGKTMLMDLFFNCCKVSKYAVLTILHTFSPHFPIIWKHRGKSFQLKYASCLF